MAQKSNSHYAPQSYTNRSVFKSLLNCTSEISLSRNATGRELQRHSPASEKLVSLRRVCVLFVTHVKTSAGRSQYSPVQSVFRVFVSSVGSVWLLATNVHVLLL